MAAGEFPKMSPRVVFLLRKSSCSIQGRACPLTQPISPARPGTVWIRTPHGPTLNCPQPAPTVSVGLALPCHFKQPGLSRCCSSFVWQGRESLAGLSSSNIKAVLEGKGLGLQLPCSPCWSHRPLCPKAIPLRSVFSVSSILFGLLPS